MNDPEPGPGRFDPRLGGWILTSHADVAAALREPRLSVSGTPVAGHAAHLAVREAGAQAFPAARLAQWRTEIETSARALARSLPRDQSVDLVETFAAPWSLALAVTATGALPQEAERLARLARQVFLAAARSTNGEPEPEAQAAALALAGGFPGEGASIAVQAFVALSHTLPFFLAGAWHELFRHPEETLRLRTDPDLMPQAIEELLRYASPARAVFRVALAPVSIGAAGIGPGERVILMLSAANRDPAQFPDPDRLDLRRGGQGHLAFGRGTHACSGAQLIRMAAAVATDALLQATDAVEPIGQVDWIGGFAIRAPASLPVILRRESGEQPGA
jgi:cytochrome P450